MAHGKVVFFVNQIMDKKRLDQNLSYTPDGWEATFIDKTIDESKVIATLADAEYIVTVGSRPVPVKYVENNKKLKLLQHGGQDVGHFPLQWAFDHGIPVANAGGANAIAVSEFTVLLILSCIKHFQESCKSTMEGKWLGYMEREAIMRLYDKTVGIVGFGNIGRRVAKLCYCFGANIIYSEKLAVPEALRGDMKARPVSLNELLKTSDVVSLHIPSAPGREAIIGWEQLCLMKPMAYLINTSRGSNVDETALIRALNEKKIAGAALDVWSKEPTDPDNPLLKMPNVISTPHMAGSARENIIPTFEAVWRNILLVSEGQEPLSQVRP